MGQISNTVAGLVDKRLRLLDIAFTDEIDVIDLWGATGHELSLILPDFSVMTDKPSIWDKSDPRQMIKGHVLRRLNNSYFEV
jgi:hypothetical protein